MAEEIKGKDLAVLLQESWDFFSKRWIILFQITLFVWIPILLITPLANILWTSYNSLKNKPELLFSIKVILSGGILLFTVIGMFVLILLMDKLMKVAIMENLWEKPEEKYYLGFIKLAKEVWPKMRELFNAQLLAWAIILSVCLLFFVPVMFFLYDFLMLLPEENRYLLFFVPGLPFIIWFSFVPYEVILRGKTGKDALYSSKNIVSYNFIKFIGNMSVMIVILFFVNIGLTGFFKLIFSFSGSKDLANIGELAAAIIFNIFSLWLTVFHFNLYKELEKRYLMDQEISTHNPEASA